MPLEIKSQTSGVHRCAVCGKVTRDPIFYKTCCMNKPVIFCSKKCAKIWVSRWVRNQEQIISRRSRLATQKTVLRRDII